MNVIIRTGVKILFPLILLIGIYVIVHGHLTPGGSFSGGSIVAGAFILYTLAYGLEKTERELKESVVDILKSSAGFILIVLILFEFLLRRFLVPLEVPFTLFSGGPLIFFNVIGGVMVFSGLLVIWYSIVKTDSD